MLLIALKNPGIRQNSGNLLAKHPAVAMSLNICDPFIFATNDGVGSGLLEMIGKQTRLGVAWSRSLMPRDFTGD